MSAYAVFELTFVDDATADDLVAYERYRSEVVSLIAAHGGRYLARAWGVTALEGLPAGDRCHLVEFPDAESARAFWSDPEYLAPTPLRSGAVEVRAILIEQN
ncbi:MAG: DUF1330 domain-containing protein [Ilumatobacteraceae bacterium]